MAAVDICKVFGKRVRELREKMGISQEELGHRAKIHRTYIGSVERGEQNISLKNIYKIAQALNVSLSDLFKFLIITSISKSDSL